MGEWSSYAIADFLPYDRETAYRLMELANAHLWPLHLLGIVFALMVARAVWRPGAVPVRQAAAAVALAWLVLALGFIASELAPLLWVGSWLAGAAAAFALLPLSIALRMPRTPAAWSPGSLTRRAALALLIWALIGHPLLGPLVARRSWAGLEWFAVAPAPTALATLALAVVCPPVQALMLAPGPLVWFMLAGASSYALGAVEVQISLAVALLLLLIAIAARAADQRTGPRASP
ncbi:MAG: hypothetical protein R3E83_07355 [Burkholderiaceae bacterium]